MTSLIASTLLALTLISGTAQAMQADNPLRAERWKTRPLVVVAARAQDPALLQLQDDLQQPANREAFVERDMVLFTVIDGAATRNGEALGAAASAALLAALAVDGQGPTQTFLVGKDGGVKVTRTGTIDTAALFATIDRMPMRR